MATELGAPEDYRALYREAFAACGTRGLWNNRALDRSGLRKRER